MIIPESLMYTIGKRVQLDTVLRISNYDTNDWTKHAPTGTICRFRYTAAAETIIAGTPNSNLKDFDQARKDAARLICHEVYGELADKLITVVHKDYETNKSGDSEVRKMLNKIINELRGYK